MEAETIEGENNPPDLLLFGGEWEKYEEKLFEIFQNTIVSGNINFLGLVVKPRWFPDFKGKHFTFWHLISEGEKEDERIPDLRRCERLAWVAWVILNHSTHPKISYWQERRRRGDRDYVIWYEEGNYIVVLSKRGQYYLLKTAYHTVSKRKLAKLAQARASAPKE